MLRLEIEDRQNVAKLLSSVLNHRVPGLGISHCGEFCFGHKRLGFMESCLWERRQTCKSFLNNKNDESLCRVFHILHCQFVGSRGQSHETGRAGIITEETESPRMKQCQKTEQELEVRGLNSQPAQRWGLNKVKFIDLLDHACHIASLHAPWHPLLQVGSLGPRAAALLCCIM